MASGFPPLRIRGPPFPLQEPKGSGTFEQFSVFLFGLNLVGFAYDGLIDVEIDRFSTSKMEGRLRKWRRKAQSSERWKDALWR